MYYDSNGGTGIRRLPGYSVQELPVEEITARPVAAGGAPPTPPAAPRPMDPMTARMSAAANPTAAQRLTQGMSAAAAVNPGVQESLLGKVGRWANRTGLRRALPAAAGQFGPLAAAEQVERAAVDNPEWRTPEAQAQAGEFLDKLGPGPAWMFQRSAGAEPNRIGATPGAQPPPPYPPATPAAAPPNAAPPPAPAGRPVDLGEITGNGRPADFPNSPAPPRPVLPGATAQPEMALTPRPLPQGEGVLPASSDPSGRIMGLDRVQPGQGFASMEQAPSVSAARQRLGIQEGPGTGLPAAPEPGGGPVRYEIGEGGQVRKFGGDGRELPMRGGVSYLGDDQTAATAEKEVAHAQGMQRLRQGLPYDPREFAALQQQQARAAREDKLWQAATGPVSSNQSPGNFGAAIRKQKLAGALLGQELGGHQATDLATQKALADWYMSQAKGQQEYQREIAKADRAGQWNVEQELAKPRPDEWDTKMQQTDQGEVPYTYSKRTGKPRELPPGAAPGEPGGAETAQGAPPAQYPWAKQAMRTPDGGWAYLTADGQWLVPRGGAGA